MPPLTNDEIQAHLKTVSAKVDQARGATDWITGANASTAKTIADDVVVTTTQAVAQLAEAVEALKSVVEDLVNHPPSSGPLEE